MQSKAATVKEYLAGLPDDRRAAIEQVRKVILKNLDADYREGMQYGMIGYWVPHSVFPPGYHCDPKQPLPFAGLASQKNHLSVYLMGVYGEGEARFRKEWAKSGKKLDMGKCCVRFKSVEDLALDVIGATVKSWPASKYVAHYQANLELSRSARGKPAKPAKAAKAPPKAKSAAKPKRA
jgi:hypothetical protein